MMTLFSSPAYATMLSMETSFWDEKPRLLIVHLPVPLCLMIHLLLAKTIADASVIPSHRVKCELHHTSSVLERGRGQTNVQAE